MWPKQGMARADGAWQCAARGRQTSVTAGTLFHRSTLDLRLWFRAMWWVTGHKHGTGALGLQRVLGLGSYRTAWTWLHKLRRAMVRPGRDRLHPKLAGQLLPHVHRIASLFKRWWAGTHQGAIRARHLDYYLVEFSFRFNRRNVHTFCKLSQLV